MYPPQHSAPSATPSFRPLGRRACSASPVTSTSRDGLRTAAAWSARASGTPKPFRTSTARSTCGARLVRLQPGPRLLLEDATERTTCWDNLAVQSSAVSPPDHWLPLYANEWPASGANAATPSSATSLRTPYGCRFEAPRSGAGARPAAAPPDANGRRRTFAHPVPAVRGQREPIRGLSSSSATPGARQVRPARTVHRRSLRACRRTTPCGERRVLPQGKADAKPPPRRLPPRYDPPSTRRESVRFGASRSTAATTTERPVRLFTYAA